LTCPRLILRQLTHILAWFYLMVYLRSNCVSQGRFDFALQKKMTNIDILKKKYLHFLIIAAITIVAYANSFNVPFQFDDRANIVENSYIKDFSYFASPPDTIDKAILFQTRYLGYLSFAVNYALGGLDVRGYHVVNISIHLANAALIYFFVVLLFKTPRIVSSRLAGHAEFVALFTSLCFALHPVQTQAVTYIVQRLASMATMFYLGSVVLYINHRLSGKRLWYAGSLLSGLCAMYTKELSITLPVMVLLAEIVFFDGRLRERAKRLVPFGLMVFVIPVTMVFSSGFYGNIIGTQGLEATLPRYDYLMTEFRVIATYLRLLVAPYGQNIDYDYPVYHSFWNPAVFMSFMLLSSILCGACYALIKTRKDHAVWDPASRLASFGILWFFIALSVESSIIPIRDIIFEHRLYLPSVGFMICAVALFFLLMERIPVSKRALAQISALIIISVVLTLATYYRNTVWKSMISFWSDVVKKSPEKYRGIHSLGAAYYDAGDYSKAITYFERALRIDIINSSQGYYDISPQDYYSQAYFELGTAYYDAVDYNKAITYLEMALQLSHPDDETYGKTCNNLSTSYIQAGMNEKAIEMLRTCLDKFPNAISLYVNLAEGYKRNGQFSEAISTFEKALQIDPNHYENLSGERVLEKDSNLYEALTGLANMFKLTGKTENAIIYYKKALAVREGDVIANSNLASIFLKAKEPDKALPYIKAFLAKEPGNSNAVYLLEMYNNLKKMGIQQAQ
jgi:tetratricopeptide (TPR) repeat protein